MKKRPPRKKLVMSFPTACPQILHWTKGDSPITANANKTGRLLAQETRPEAPSNTSSAFSPRFGKAEWLKPYTTRHGSRSWAGKKTKTRGRSLPGVCPPTAWKRWKRSRRKARRIFQHAGGGRIPLTSPASTSANDWMPRVDGSG